MQQCFLRFLYLFMILILWSQWLSEGQATEAVYHNYTQFSQQLEKLNQQYPQLTHLESIGKTRQGNSIWALTITKAPKTAAEKSAIAIVGNIDGNHLVGSEMVLYTAQYLLSNYGKIDSVTRILDDHALYLLPRINVDAAEAFFRKPVSEMVLNAAPIDNDFDGLTDEDQPEDLNNDGLITLMRIPDTQGQWVVDSTDARLLREVDPQKGESGRYRIEIEGIDNDGDDQINEDPLGGVHLNHNFPQAYPQYQPDAGQFMLSEPEARSLVEFMLDHRNIALVLIYGLEDNLLKPPDAPKTKSESPKKPESNRRQRHDFSSMKGEDIFIYQKISEAYIRLTKQKATPIPMEPAGAFSQWVYFQFGAPALCSRVWYPPELKTATKDSTTNSTEDSTKTAPKANKKKATPKKSEDAQWLAWIDAEKIPHGFIPWQSYQHPKLGAIEIGGFAPYSKTNPPARYLEQYGMNEAKFAVYLGTILPSLKIKSLEVTKQTDSVYLINVKIEKTGLLPDITEFARKSRAAKPTMVRIQYDQARILAGIKNVYLDQIHLDGQQQEVEWLVSGKAGTKLVLEVLAEKANCLTREIILK